MSQQDTAAPRTDAVNLLWQLKRLSDQRRDLGLPTMHFRMLLEDLSYRADTLRRANQCAEPEVQSLLSAIQGMGELGVLRAKPRTAPNPAPRKTPAADFADIDSAHTEAVQHGRSRSLPVLLGSSILAAALAVGWLAMGKPGLGGSSENKPRAVPTTISENTRWGAGAPYQLQGLTYVEPGVRLTIDAGVTVHGTAGSALIVSRGAYLHARGTSSDPIVFTSSKPVGTRAAGDWGGVALLGNAPVNVDSAHLEGVPSEDPRGAFGGNDRDSGCGLLEYVRIEFAGYEISRDNELNGLTVAGCGTGTVLRNLQIHRGLDDGVEMFGGAADLKYVLVSGASDDAFDWDLGWTGRGQFLAALLYPNTGDNAFEGDNNGKAMDASPRSAPMLYNVTMMASPESERVHRGMTLREGTGAMLANAIISGFNGEAVDFRDQETVALIPRGELSFAAILLHNNGVNGTNAFPAETGASDDDGGFSESDYFTEPRAYATRNVGLLRGAHVRNPPDLVPDLIDLPVAAVRPPEGEFWDEGATFIGAFRPATDKSRSWIAGWTAFPAN